MLRQSLSHSFAHRIKVIMSGLRGHQVFGSAVFAFKHRIDHAKFTQHIELAVNGGGGRDMPKVHGGCDRQRVVVGLMYRNHFKQFFGFKVHLWRVLAAFQSMKEVQKAHVDLFGFHVVNQFCYVSQRFKLYTKPRTFELANFTSIMYIKELLQNIAQTKVLHF